MPPRVAVVGRSPTTDWTRAALAGHVEPAEPADADVVVSMGADPQRVRMLTDGLRSQARLVHVSTALVYGPRREALPLDEDTPLHPPAGLEAVVDQAEAERIVGMLRAERPEACTVLRPALGNHDPLFGPIVRSEFRVRGSAPVHQFLHPDDLVGALRWAIETSTPGIFNVTPADTIGLAEVRRVAGGHRLPLPTDAARRLAARLQRIGVGQLPPAAVPLLVDPPVLSPARLEAAGFRCRHGSLDALEAGLEARRNRSMAVPAAAGLAGLGVAVWIWSRRRSK